MQIAWAVSCESYELREDGTADISAAGYDTFYVEGFPARIETTILVRLMMEESEREMIELQVLGPDTSSLGTLTHEIEAEPGPNHRPGFLVTQVEALGVGFLAESEGVYSVEIYTGGRRPAVTEDRRRSIFFNVRQNLP